ncbi:Uncharacterized protein PECH_001140 [Penicillium ucsense]|uniref:LisH domain-containing protein n=1 Tax=Penicillium ucsense TaxID=2839758 RepID=A0A8J8VXP7_9EURO|nr:Uncharacterized protein PECM_000828 [Penicillium ucsense]KAF7733150.1 Uncharacterized protein PECH_001140 [Penicillium ucsense]
MAQPDLTSHHVNYLIWRYLQESGHGDAAVSLQRAWYPNPQTLPFARHIKTHALVSLVQKGLQYHELESSIDKEGNPTTFTPERYFFGPEPFDVGSLKPKDEPTPAPAGSPKGPVPEHVEEAATEPVSNGGHAADPAQDSHATETNGDEAMEVDRAESKPSSPQPQAPEVDGDGDVSMGATELEEKPREPTLTTGNSVGVQISPAKAADLSPDAVLLNEEHAISATWCPKDSSLLLATGDTFCSLWKLSAAAEPARNRFLDLKGTGAFVSAVAWDSAGAKLVVASYRQLKGTVAIYNTDGKVMDLLPDMPRVINGLYWAKDSPHLVIVASDERSSELVLWDDGRRPDVYPPSQTIENHLYDVAWCGRNRVFACGKGSVYECEVSDNIRLLKSYPSPQADTQWTYVRSIHDGDTLIAVTASAASSAIWIPTHDILVEAAHQAAITGIDIKPHAALPRQEGNLSISFASFSIDGTIAVWQADLVSKEYKCIHRLSLGASSPAFTGSFSPDGYALGAVSRDQVLIWNAERGGDPIATCKAPRVAKVKEDPDRATNGQNGHGPSYPDRALSWDLDGKKLVCGLGEQMAVINFQR